MTCTGETSDMSANVPDENNESSHPLVRDMGKKIGKLANADNELPLLSVGDLPDDPEARGRYAMDYHRGIQDHIAKVVADYYVQHPDKQPPTSQSN
jgi:hypothetical protein